MWRHRLHLLKYQILGREVLLQLLVTLLRIQFCRGGLCRVSEIWIGMSMVREGWQLLLRWSDTQGTDGDTLIFLSYLCHLHSTQLDNDMFLLLYGVRWRMMASLQLLLVDGSLKKNLLFEKLVLVLVKHLLLVSEVLLVGSLE